MATKITACAIVESEKIQPAMLQNAKWVYTLAVCFCFMTRGLGDTLDSPSLKDLAENLSSSFEDLSYAQVAYSLAHCVGALIAGLLFSRINRQVGYAGCLFGMAGVLFLTPLQHKLYMYICLRVAAGCFIAGIDVASNTWMLEMWHESSNPFLQGMHLTSATARTISRLAVGPFLGSNVSNYSASSPNALKSLTSRIFIPYTLISLIMTTAAVLLLILLVKMPYLQPCRTVNRAKKEDPDSIDMIDKSSASILVPKESNERNSQKLVVVIVILGCLLICFTDGSRHLTSFFMPSFAIFLHYSRSKAALMSSAFEGSFAAFRALFLLFAVDMDVKRMLYLCLTFAAVGHVLLAVFARTSEPMTWIAVVVLGAGYSCMYAGIFSFLEQRINVTNAVSGFLTFASSASDGLLTILLGDYMESHPFIFIYPNLISILICYLILLAFTALDRLTLIRS